MPISFVTALLLDFTVRNKYIIIIASIVRFTEERWCDFSRRSIISKGSFRKRSSRRNISHRVVVAPSSTQANLQYAPSAANAVSPLALHASRITGENLISRAHLINVQLTIGHDSFCFERARGSLFLSFGSIFV